MLITDNPDDDEDEPEFKYVATMHGDEPVGTEMCLYFVDLLLTEYGTNERITNLIDSTSIWIVPLMNPDGLELGRRANANGFDLNRNFPVLNDSSGNIFTGEPLDAANRQPETRHIMNWTAENSFVLSANFHGGALVAVYPYSDDGKGSVDSPTPDDLLFEDISRRYSMHNPPMWNSSTFPDGIVNSALWYPVIGEMADWNYRYVSCNEVTIELSNNFRPSASQIPSFWADNEESMLSYLEAVHIGVRGIITDRITGEPLYAEVWVEDINHPVFTDPNVGDYHRMLLPGIYHLTFNAPGYVPRFVRNVPVTDDPATRIDVELVAEDALADFDENGRVDFNDFAILAQYWRQDEPSVDIAPLPSGDGIVDYKDLAVLADYWLTAWRIPPLPAPASNPNPANDAFSVYLNADLSWTASTGATSHDVYFGVTDPPPFIGNQTATTFDPCTMGQYTTYYWRIDEVNAWGKTKGQVWTFTAMGLESTVPNGDFELIYKPGSVTITADLGDGSTEGVGPDAPMDSGIATYFDGTTGDWVDIPGWIGADPQGWIDWGGTYDRDTNFPNRQGSIQANGVDGSYCYLAIGGDWGNPAGGLIVSDASLGNVEDGIYTLSMVANGGATPVVLELLADGDVITPTSSVSPDLTGDFQEFSRTYDSDSLVGFLGEPLTIRLGVGRDAAGGQTRFDNVTLSHSSE